MPERRRPRRRDEPRPRMRSRMVHAARRRRRAVLAPTEQVVSGVLSRLGYRQVSSRWRRRLRRGAIGVLAILAALLVVPRALDLGDDRLTTLDRFVGTFVETRVGSDGRIDVVEWLGGRVRRESAASEPPRGPTTILAAAPWSST